MFDPFLEFFLSIKTFPHALQDAGVLWVVSYCELAAVLKEEILSDEESRSPVSAGECVRLNKIFEQQGGLIVKVALKLLGIVQCVGKFAMTQQFWPVGLLDFDLCKNAIVAGNDSFNRGVQ